MLTSRVIACLDCRNGRVVKGVRFQSLRDAGSPAERASEYALQGADEVVVLDVSATTERRAHGLKTLRAIRAGISIPLAVGGGIRNLDDACALFDAGADRIVVNSAAVARPKLLTEIANRFGSQSVVLSLDAAASGPCKWQVVVHSGMKSTGLDPLPWAAEAARRGAGEILITSWDRDGTKNGYDLDLIRELREAVPLSLVASGGAASAKHLIDALRAGADAVLAASMFHSHGCRIDDVKRTMAKQGIQVRLQ